MDRRPSRWIRTLAIMIGGTTGTAVLFAGTANAAGPATGTVVANGGLTLRTTPDRSLPGKGFLPNGTQVTILCQVAGERVVGQTKTTNSWDKLSNGYYVSDAFVAHESAIAACGDADPSAVSLASSGSETAPAGAAAGLATRGWITPVQAKATSGFRSASRPTHDGVDLMVPKGTTIVAPADGKVITVTCDTSNGSCDVDGSLAVRGCGWYLEIQHTGATSAVTRYCHLLKRPAVSVGQSVSRGQLLGYSGNSGNSSGPHLHFEVHSGAPATRANAVEPVAFMTRMGATFK